MPVRVTTIFDFASGSLGLASGRGCTVEAGSSDCKVASAGTLTTTPFSSGASGIKAGLSLAISGHRFSFPRVFFAISWKFSESNRTRYSLEISALASLVASVMLMLVLTWPFPSNLMNGGFALPMKKPKVMVPFFGSSNLMFEDLIPL